MAGKLLIVEPMALAATQLYGVSAGTLANMLTPDPKEISSLTAAGAVDIVVDLGSARLVDSFYFGGTNLNAQTWRVSKCDDLARTNTVVLDNLGAFKEADSLEARASGFHRLAAPVSSRYFAIRFNAPPATLELGSFAMGLAFTADWNIEWGSGRRLVDTSKVTQLQGGGFGVQPGARKAAYSWTFGDLTDAETETLWGIVKRMGVGNPLVVVEREAAADHRAERRHYGLFRRIDQFERRDPQATKWDLEIEEWI